MFGFPAKPTSPNIRRIGPEASRDCANIHAQCFARRWSPVEFESLLGDRNVIADAAIESRSRRMAGFVLSRSAADEAEILTIAVAPAFRRKGMAGALLGAHIGRLGGLGVRRLFLEVDGENQAALTLYAGFGFRQVGERKAYYTRPDASGANALILRRELG
jgi:[ribosomal protein S18]-alanine N-acetyltransferase